MALWSLARKHQPCNQRADGLVKLQSGMGRGSWGGHGEGPGDNSWPRPQASWPVCLSRWKPRRSSWTPTDAWFLLLCLLSRFSPRRSQPHEECFCVISKAAVDEVGLGHQRERPWENVRSPWEKALCHGAWGLWYQRRRVSWGPRGALSVLAFQRPRAKLYARLK